MSMLRCLYRRLKFVKCALGEPGTSSIHLKVSTNSRASYQCIITRNLHGMTCDKNNTAGSSESAAAVANGKADNSLVRNGLIVDSALRSGGGSFLSNGYYRTEWGQQGSGNQTNGEKARRGNTSKCEFDLNFINVRLLGLLGTAVAVGINVNSHINDWMPYQSRGIHDLCHYQHHHRKHSPLYGGPSSGPKASSTNSSGSGQCGVSPTPLSRALDCLHTKSNNEANNFTGNGTSASAPTTTVIQSCGSCRSCSDLLNKILQVYSNFPTVSSTSTTSSIASSILNVLPRSAAPAALPPVFYGNSLGAVNQADSSSSVDAEHLFADEVDGGGTVGVDLTSSTGLRRLQFDSVSNSNNSAFTNKRRTSPVPEQKPEKKQQQPQKKEAREESPPPRTTQRKKSIYQITEEESEQLQQLAAKSSTSSESSESDYISLSASSDESTVSADEAKVTPAPVAATSQPAKSPPSLSTSLSSSSSSSSTSTSTSEDEPDIATVFRLASIEYADQLNNLVAISLMDTHHPDEAMQFWSSCEASSRAFFNMGVAYESGRHAKRAKPDLDRAHDCYALAASMGHRDAIYNLSLFYLYGKGKIEVNLERGLELLETAAVKGVVAAQKFIVELRRTQFIDDLREDLQRTRSRVDILKNRPQRTSNAHFRPPLRPSPSLFGPKATPLKMKQSTAAREGDAEHSSLSKKRSNSFPDLMALNDSPNAVAAK